jgi:7-cyano-7-deazaguanine synthase in queuosine biosynthesis
MFNNTLNKINDNFGSIENKTISTDDIAISTNFKAQGLNSIIRTAVMNLYAGYKIKEKITVYGDNLGKIININEFASLNLNIINAGPKIFKMRVNYKPILKFNNNKAIDNDISNYDTILLMSGGIDSASGLFYCLDKKYKVLPVWIDFGQKNLTNEKKSMQNLQKTLNLPVAIIKIDLKKYIDDGWKSWKYGIIPSRNFMLVSLVSLMIDMNSRRKIRIMLCATRDEYNPNHQDKSPNFYRNISKLLSTSFNKKITVVTPFKKYNKTELIKYWIKVWEKKYGVKISDTISCYTNDFCGKCPACYNRNIYGSAAGYSEVYKCKVNPFNDDARMIRDYHLNNYSKWNNTRKLDFLIALSRNKRHLPDDVKKFLIDKENTLTCKIRLRKAFLNRLVIK